MKVEFLESDVLGAELLISAAEFVKAKNSGVEYDSLTHATSAFAGLLGLDYQISEEEYKAVCDRLDKTGTVIFTIGESQYPSRRWCEICVSNGNGQLEKVVYEDNGGYHIKKVGKYVPKAMARIRKRHEAEEKRHE